MRWGAAVSLTGQTGQSEETHSPAECASVVVSRISPAASSIEVVCTVAISCRPSDLRTRSNPLDNEAERKLRSPSRGNGERMVAVRDFSGLANSICALASAPAIAPIDSLQRCMTDLRHLEIKADGAGLAAVSFKRETPRLGQRQAGCREREG